MIEYKGYTGVFEYDREIDSLSGYVVDLGDQIYFEGRSVEIRGAQSNLRNERFNDRASSAIVYGRAWEVCEHANFQNCRILQPGRYADLRSMGLNDGISSLRPLR